MKLTAVFILFCFATGFSQSYSQQNLLTAKLSLQQTDNSLDNQSFEFNRLLPQPEKKSAGLAILYSFILPGMGEIYAGDYSLGRYFTIADAALWGIFAGMNYYGSWQRDNYKAFAQANAGINPENKDEQYFATIGVYLNVDQYNREHELYREYDKLYDTKTHHWNWVSNSVRKEYRTMWLSSEKAFNSVRFVVGALLLNRVVSIINAVRLVSRYNKNLDKEVSWNMSAELGTLPDNSMQLNLNFVRSF